MVGATRRLLPFTLLAALSGCALPLPTGEGAARLYVGAAMAPPSGALDYCARVLGACESSEVSGLRGVLPATGAAGIAPRFTQGAASAAPRDTNAVFQALLAGRMQASAAAPGSQIALTDASWRALLEVNRRVNRAIQPATDSQIYGVEERWSRPLAEHPGAFVVRGDCEDYALEKRAQLMEAGWPADALALAIAVVPNVGLHAVLVVQTDQGDFVLDNLHTSPRRVTHRDYAWVSRQVGPGLDRWTSASARRVDAAIPLPSHTETAAQQDFSARLNAARLEAAGRAEDKSDERAPTPQPAESAPVRRRALTATDLVS